MRKLFSVLLVLALALTLIQVTAVLAAEEGTSTGSFSIGGVAPSVSTLQVYSDSGCTTVAAALTPQVMYYVKVTISDPNTVNDIKEVKLKVYYDALATNPDESTITTGNEQTAGIFTWTKIGNSWSVNAGAGTTWVVASDSSVTPSNMGASTGDWIFAIKLGKVATETTGPAVWRLHARATDAANYNAGLYCPNTKAVMWYGEVQVVTASINFGEITLGSGFAADVNKVTDIQVKFIANGDYWSRVKSSATWTGTSNIATLDPSGACVNPNEFALKLYHADIYGSAYLLNASGVDCRAGSQTLEAGDSITTGTFWLKIASVFPTDIYSGTITFMIVNR